MYLLVKITRRVHMRQSYIIRGQIMHALKDSEESKKITFVL